MRLGTGILHQPYVYLNDEWKRCLAFSPLLPHPRVIDLAVFTWLARFAKGTIHPRGRCFSGRVRPGQFLVLFLAYLCMEVSVEKTGFFVNHLDFTRTHLHLRPFHTSDSRLHLYTYHPRLHLQTSHPRLHPHPYHPRLHLHQRNPQHTPL